MVLIGAIVIAIFKQFQKTCPDVQSGLMRGQNWIIDNESWTALYVIFSNNVRPRLACSKHAATLLAHGISSWGRGSHPAIYLGLAYVDPEICFPGSPWDLGDSRLC
jgi:hypothetical protein